MYIMYEQRNLPKLSRHWGNAVKPNRPDGDKSYASLKNTQFTGCHLCPTTILMLKKAKKYNIIVEGAT